MKFKVPESCTSLSLGGTDIDIVDGCIDTDIQTSFLLENGFTPIYETTPTVTAETEIVSVDDLKKQADELGIEYASNISAKTLLARIEAKLAETTPAVTTAGEGE